MAEATVVREPRGGGERPGPLDRMTRNLKDPARDVLTTAGEMGAFMARVVISVGGTWRYTSEVLRQAGLLITGSVSVLLAAQFFFGITCGNEGVYVLRGYGASAYAGVFTALCPIRECTPMLFGYLLSAKVGCGLAAEVGSMNISEELYAMESLGVNPMVYVCATRLLAAVIIAPATIIMGLTMHYLGNYVVVVLQIGEISQGTWESVHWLFNDIPSIIFMSIKTMWMFIGVTLVGLYYGYNARGGPIGVGEATAKSMIANLILVHLLNEGGTFFFWGLDPRVPIGG